MIINIEQGVIWTASQDGFSGFHPRCCVAANGTHRTLLMTVQEISGSDYFRGVQWCESMDEGHTWSLRTQIESLQWTDYGDGITEGVCDVVPEFHPNTQTVLAIGHNVFYQDGHLLDTLGDVNCSNEGFRRRIQRYPVYTVRTSVGNWSERKKLQCPEFEGCSIYTCGCSQRVTLENGNILIPICFGHWGRNDRMVCSIECTFDGSEITFVRMGNVLELPVRRGLDEPQMTRVDDTFYLTMRAEDDHGYVAISDDGLNWSEINPWCWQNGESLSMSSTQQHWLVLGDDLYLTYNRKAENNINVRRWRAPLFIAKVDKEKLCLLRETEKVVFPLKGDGMNEDNFVAMMGNSHPLAINANRAIVTVGAYNYRATPQTSETLIAWIDHESSSP